MLTRRRREACRELEARLWTGPAGHFLGGALDLLEALTRYVLARARGKRLRP